MSTYRHTHIVSYTHIYFVAVAAEKSKKKQQAHPTPSMVSNTISPGFWYIGEMADSKNGQEIYKKLEVFCVVKK